MNAIEQVAPATESAAGPDVMRLRTAPDDLIASGG